MPLITDNIRLNAEKCKKCAFQKLRNIELDKNSIMYDEAMMVLEPTLEGIYMASCNMCPYAKDFEKVYGMKPYDYFPRKETYFAKKKKKKFD